MNKIEKRRMWKTLPLEKWAVSHNEAGDEILFDGGWPEFPNVGKYKNNTDDETKPYCWSKTDRFAHLMTKEAWLGNVKCGGFIDYDGDGHLLIFRDGDYYPTKKYIWPGIAAEWPKNATHIDWFNK